MQAPANPYASIWERLKNTASFAWRARDQARLPFLPLESIRNAQARRLRHMVRHAYTTVPFYRRTMERLGLRPEDIRTASDLSLLPIIEPSQLRDVPSDFFSTAYSPKACVQLFSSGSTGEPRYAYHAMDSVLLNAAHGQRERAAFLPLIGSRYGYRETLIGTPISADRTLQRVIRCHTWVPSGFPVHRQYLSALDPPETNLDMMNRFRPHVLRGLGSYLAMLFGYLARNNAPFHKPRVIVYGSDDLPEAIRDVVEKRFGIPVFALYGAIESLKIGFECEVHSGLHANVDLYPIRIVSGDGKDAPVGETGEVVISNLVNRATVLLNYRIGDLAAWDETDCACGRSLPLLKRLAGRRDDFIRLPSGRIVHPLAAKGVFRNEPDIWQYQIVQETPSCFSANVVAAPWADRTALEARLISGLLREMNEEIQLQVRFVSNIKRTRSGKSRDIVSVLESRCS